ncbi:hypothetical protein V8E53_011984 [Lactarius tabidus]
MKRLMSSISPRVTTSDYRVGRNRLLKSSTHFLGGGVGLIFSPADVISAGVGVLLLHIENFKRLESYTEVPPTDAMTDMIAKVMADIFAIGTKEMKQGRALGRAQKFLKRLFGWKDVEYALNILDKLTQEESQIAAAQILKLTLVVESYTFGHRCRKMKKISSDTSTLVVYSDSEMMMMSWRNDEKKMVVEALSENADGMFRWAFYQLDTLRQCLPSSVRLTQPILKDIRKSYIAPAYRLLQCLAVAIRPLSVADLAELLAFYFATANMVKRGIPELNPNWH